MLTTEASVSNKTPIHVMRKILIRFVLILKLSLKLRVPLRVSQPYMIRLQHINQTTVILTLKRPFPLVCTMQLTFFRFSHQSLLTSIQCPNQNRTATQQSSQGNQYQRLSLKTSKSFSQARTVRAEAITSIRLIRR
jgi:hypothetical protein